MKKLFFLALFFVPAMAGAQWWKVTATPTLTPTNTPLGSYTPTSTPTLTPTNSCTYTPTFTSTLTPTNTTTNTPSNTTTPNWNLTNTPVAVTGPIYSQGITLAGSGFATLTMPNVSLGTMVLMVAGGGGTIQTNINGESENDFWFDAGSIAYTSLLGGVSHTFYTCASGVSTFTVTNTSASLPITATVSMWGGNAFPASERYLFYNKVSSGVPVYATGTWVVNVNGGVTVVLPTNTNTPTPSPTGSPTPTPTNTSNIGNVTAYQGANYTVHSTDTPPPGATPDQTKQSGKDIQLTALITATNTPSPTPNTPADNYFRVSDLAAHTPLAVIATALVTNTSTPSPTPNAPADNYQRFSDLAAHTPLVAIATALMTNTFTPTPTPNVAADNYQRFADLAAHTPLAVIATALVTNTSTPSPTANASNSNYQRSSVGFLATPQDQNYPAEIGGSWSSVHAAGGAVTVNGAIQYSCISGAVSTVGGSGAVSIILMVSQNATYIPYAAATTFTVSGANATLPFQLQGINTANCYVSLGLAASTTVSGAVSLTNNCFIGTPVATLTAQPTPATAGLQNAQTTPIQDIDNHIGANLLNSPVTAGSTSVHATGSLFTVSAPNGSSILTYFGCDCAGTGGTGAVTVSITETGVSGGSAIPIATVTFAGNTSASFHQGNFAAFSEATSCSGIAASTTFGCWGAAK